MEQGQEAKGREQAEEWEEGEADKVRALAARAEEAALPPAPEDTVSAPTVVKKRPIRRGYPVMIRNVQNVVPL